ncbi:glycine-rich domain-containing protein [Yersinia canariae]|uniref:glycine-rich domain-containing protein n=1 Tax=Yersinia canariae TaxID=2607663 RepID=UPI0011A713B4|nr:phage tail protein [Yersinia canariae]
MDRQIVYPGAIPLETDLLNTNKYAMIGIAKLASTVMGVNTYLRGLSCTASSPASMIINIARGEIYSLQNIDNTAYSSLPADTVNTILKQGVILTTTPFTLTAPTTAGQSINYLIQVAYQDVDTGATVLPYYNAANPSQAYSGPNNSGVAQYTARTGVCVVSLKSGVAAITGTQTTPSADAGYTAAWAITVAQGATTITSANIAVALNAPFLPVSGLVDGIQRNAMTFASDTGSANTYVASYLPNLPTIADGIRLTFKAKTGNTGASTFSPNGSASAPIYSHANQALQGGEIAANGLVEVEWNSTNSAWILCGNSGGATPVLAGTQSNHAVNLGQLKSRAMNIQKFTSSGSFIVPDGVTQLWVSGCAAGGGGGSSLASDSASFVTGGSGGGAGQPVMRIPITVTPGQVIPVTIGNGGTGGAAATNNATAGGNTQLGVGGALLNLVGGSPGSLGGGGTTFPASYGGPPGGIGYPNGSYALDTVSFSATTAYGGLGGQGASGPFGQAGSAGRGAMGQGVAAFAGFGYGAGGSGAGGAYRSATNVAGAAGAAGLNGYLVIEW